MIAGCFLLAVILMLFSIWRSGNMILQKTGLVLLAAWSLTNVAVDVMGFERAPIIIPTMHFVFGALVATVSFRKKTFASEAVLLAYAAMVTFDLLSFPLRIEGTWTYYAVLNVIFAAQLLVVGASGARLAIRHRLPARHQRRRPFRPRPAGMG